MPGSELQCAIEGKELEHGTITGNSHWTRTAQAALTFGNSGERPMLSTMHRTHVTIHSRLTASGESSLAPLHVVSKLITSQDVVSPAVKAAIKQTSDNQSPGGVSG
jgi:hypothetical protein